MKVGQKLLKTTENGVKIRQKRIKSTRKNILKGGGVIFFFSANFRSIFLKFDMHMTVLGGSVVEFFQSFRAINMILKWTLKTFGGACRIPFLKCKHEKISRSY